MSERFLVGQLAYLRQQEADTINNPAHTEIHEDGTTRILVLLHEGRENHDRYEHISTKYQKHKERNNCWVSRGCI